WFFRRAGSRLVRGARAQPGAGGDARGRRTYSQTMARPKDRRACRESESGMSEVNPLAAPLFADVAGDIDLSFEFFPPKTEKMEETLWESIQTLSPLAPRFVSVTYGAGGTTRERTHNTVARIARDTGIPA